MVPPEILPVHLVFRSLFVKATEDLACRRGQSAEAQAARVQGGLALRILWCILLGCLDFNFLPTNGSSIKPLKVELLAGEQKTTEKRVAAQP